MANELDANLSAFEASGESFFYEKESQQLCDKVLRKIDDGSYSWQEVVDEFNRCLEHIAGKFDLYDLEHTQDVATDAGINRIAMPANYMKKLMMCRSITHNRPIAIKNTVTNLFRAYSVLDQSGSVREVAVKGRELYYQRVPGSAETLRLVFYRYPTRLYKREDKPSCLPPHLIEPLLVNYACKEIFSEIEDGIEGSQVNTDRYTKKFVEAELELQTFLGPERREPVEFPEEIAWDVYV